MKRTLAFVLTLLGIAGLTFGVITLFNSGISNSNAWIGVVLGGIFFSSGIGLLKTVKGNSQEA